MATRTDLARRLSTLTAINAVSHGVRPILSYKVLDLGGGALQIGFMTGSYAVLPFLAAVPIGALIDRHGPRRFMIGGAILALVSSLLSLAATGFQVLYLSQALLGLGHISVALAAQAYAAQSDSATGRVRGFAHLAVSTSVGQFLGPLIAGAMVPTGSTDPLRTSLALIVTSAIAATAVLLSVAGPRDGARVVDADEQALSLTKVRDLVRRPGMLSALSAGVMVLTMIDVLVAYMPLIGETRGIAPATIGLLLSLRAAAAIVSRLALPVIARSRDHRTVLRDSLALAGLGFLIMSIAPNEWSLGIGLAVIGFSLGMGTPLTGSWIAGSVAPNLRGTVLSVRMASNRFSQILIPPVLGFVVVTFGVGSLVTVSAAALMATAAGVERTRRAGLLETDRAD